MQARQSRAPRAGPTGVRPGDAKLEGSKDHDDHDNIISAFLDRCGAGPGSMYEEIALDDVCAKTFAMDADDGDEFEDVDEDEYEQAFWPARPAATGVPALAATSAVVCRSESVFATTAEHENSALDALPANIVEATAGHLSADITPAAISPMSVAPSTKK